MFQTLDLLDLLIEARKDTSFYYHFPFKDNGINLFFEELTRKLFPRSLILKIFSKPFQATLLIRGLKRFQNFLCLTLKSSLNLSVKTYLVLPQKFWELKWWCLYFKVSIPLPMLFLREIVSNLVGICLVAPWVGISQTSSIITLLRSIDLQRSSRVLACFAVQMTFRYYLFNS